LVYFLSVAVGHRDGFELVMGLVITSVMTLAIWMIAGVLGTLLLFPRWLWTNWRNLMPQTGFAKAAQPSIWDGWLDGPS
jgi:hypothetical protein